MKRITTILVAMLIAFLMGGSWSWAEAPQEQKVHKSYVCKYVGTPGEDERLQTGQNPIWVDNNALLGKDGETYVGQEFSDKHGRSIVIVANTEKLDPEPGVDQCPAPQGPPDKVTVVDDTRLSCDNGLESKTYTTVTPYILVEGEWVLDLDNAVTTSGPWTFVRDLTPKERRELKCDVPQQISLRQIDLNCDGFFVRTITISTFPDGTVTKDYSRWFKLRDATKAEKERLECLTPIDDKPEPPKDEPKADKPDEPRQPELAATGASPALAAIAAGLLAAGSGMVWFGRRRLTDQ